MKNIACVLIIIILLLVATFIFKPLHATELIATGTKDILPQTINTRIFFSALEDKELTVTGDESIQEIMNFLDNIKVRHLLITPDIYRPKFKNTYRLALVTDGSEVQHINILNNNYLKLNHKTYRIVGSPDFSPLYKMIILAQPAGSLDQFYYELIEINE